MKRILKVSLALTLLLSFQQLTSAAPFVGPPPRAVKTTAADLSELEKQVENGNANDAVLQGLAGVVGSDPRNAKAHFVLGRALDMAGFASLAEEQFRKADELDPTRPGALLELFQSKLDADDKVGAYQLLGYMAYRFPDDPAVLYMQGLLEFSRGQNGKAEEKLNRALQSPRAVTGVKSMIAALRINQHNYAQAVVLAEADLAKNPQHFYGNLMKGQALFLDGKAKQAIPYLKKAYEQRPQHPGVAELISRAYQQQGWYADALEAALYEMTLQTRADELEKAKTRVAYLVRFLDAKQTANVTEIAERRLNGRAEAPRLYFALGDVLDRLGRRREAISLYVEGLRNDPDLARGWYRLARDYERGGDIKGAVNAYSEAMRLAPNESQIALSALRFSRRLENSKRDTAWQIKQLFRFKKRSTVSSA